jgi:hypothetical protein
VSNAWFGRRQYRGFTSTYKHWKYLLDLKKIGSANEHIVRDHIRDNRLRDALTKDKNGQLRDARGMRASHSSRERRMDERLGFGPASVSGLGDEFNDTATRASDNTFTYTNTMTLDRTAGGASASGALRQSSAQSASAQSQGSKNRGQGSFDLNLALANPTGSDDGLTKQQLGKMKKHQLEALIESPREYDDDDNDSKAAAPDDTDLELVMQVLSTDDVTAASPEQTRLQEAENALQLVEIEKAAVKSAHEIDNPEHSEHYWTDASGGTNQLLDTLFDIPLYHTADWSDEDFRVIATIIRDEIDAM